MDPNAFQQVKLISNPVKSVTVRDTFTQDKYYTDVHFSPNQMNFSQGVWLIGVQSVVVRNNSEEREVKTLFDIKTSLSNTFKLLQGTSVSVTETLLTVEARLYKAERDFYDFDFVNRNPVTFYTVDSRPSDSFRVFFIENECVFMPNQKYNLDVEIRLAFQRML